MRIFSLFVLLFSLFSFSKEKVKTVSESTGKNGQNCCICFENQDLNAIWGIENTEANVICTSDHSISFQKKRGSENSFRFFHQIDWLIQPFYTIRQVAISGINLFLVYHFSLSLWQVFLQ